MAMLLTAKERLMGVGEGRWGISQLSPLHRNTARPCLDSGRISTASRTTERKSEIYVAVSDKGRGSTPPGKSLGRHQMPKKKSLIKTKPFVHLLIRTGKSKALKSYSCLYFVPLLQWKKKKKKVITSLGTHTNLLNAFHSGSNS